MYNFAPSQAIQRDGLIDFVINYHLYINRIMLWITLGAWAMSFLYAGTHDTWLLALLVGELLAGINWFAIKVIDHAQLTPCVIAVVFMLFVSLHVHQLQGIVFPKIAQRSPPR